jgi:hypothetical protein
MDNASWKINAQSLCWDDPLGVTVTPRNVFWHNERTICEFASLQKQNNRASDSEYPITNMMHKYDAHISCVCMFVNAYIRVNQWTQHSSRVAIVTQHNLSFTIHYSQDKHQSTDEDPKTSTASVRIMQTLVGKAWMETTNTSACLWSCWCGHIRNQCA